MIENDLFWMWLEYAGVITGFIYLWLEIKQKPSMWLLGGICSFLYVFIFAFSRIYADMGFNIYNFVISIYGFYQWRKSLSGDAKAERKESRLEYRRLNARRFAAISGVTLAIYVVIAALLNYLTDSPMPFGDAFTTTLSIVATWLLAKRYIEQWLFWVVVNLVSIYLYYLRGLYPTMVLYSVYAIVAFVGYAVWKKKGTYYEEA